MLSLEIVVCPYHLQVDAPGRWWEGFTGDPIVFNIADVFLQIVRGSSALEAIKPHFDFFGWQEWQGHSLMNEVVCATVLHI